mmetsp:Transcript_2069/g.5539  ORF Transcript_2069/g.5539 Transcript_2069/m.5539 type:complete len:270 (-) Transcript_2069:760-1569(-)
MARTTSAMRLSRAALSFPRHSMSSAVVPSSHPTMDGTSSRMRALPSHSRRLAVSKSSTASTIVVLRSTDAAPAPSFTVGKTTKAEALLSYSGTVLMVACEMNPSVPSEPIISLLMISIGSLGGKSTSAFRLYPVVHLMEYLRRMSAASSSSAWMRVARSTTPDTRCAWLFMNDALDASSAVSRTAPSSRTMRISLSVWYVFCDTPQHMPEELLAMIPPIMQLSMLLGSGPILYCCSCPHVRRCAASSRLISPPMRPGSTVICSPFPWMV